MTKLLRYEDRKSGIDYYGLSDNEFFKNKKTVVVQLQESNRDELCKAYDERIRNLYVNSPIGYLITMLNRELKDQEIWDKEAVTDAEN